jgi:serine/threonine-protein kinase HipA
MPTRRLEVSLDFGSVTRPVGQLLVTTSEFAFQYDEAFLDAPLPISPYGLPPIRRVVTRPIREKLWGVFEDSLPDTFGRKVLARRMRELEIVEPTVLDMLGLVGSRAMGALVYVPSRAQEVSASAVDLGLLALDTEALYRESPAKVLDALVLAAGTAGGARPKVLVGRTPDGRLWPDGGRLPAGATRWLIKFHGDDSAFSGMIEGALARLAAHAGIEVPRSDVLESHEGRRYFAVERFDRLGAERLHLHTMGGLTGRGDFDVADYAELLGVTGRLTRDIASVEACFRRMVFNVAVGNRDDHDKNFAFLMDSAGVWRLSPAYDITWSDPAIKREHTMQVGSKGRDITTGDCLGVAEAAGLPRRRARAAMEEIVVAVQQFEACAAVEEVPDHLIARIAEDIRSNVKALTSR